MEKICTDCGKPFEALGGKRTRCFECQRAATKKNKVVWKMKNQPPKGVYKPRKKPGIKSCRHCYRVFDSTESSGGFCSDTCRQASILKSESRSRTKTRERKLQDIKLPTIESNAFSTFNRARKNVDGEILKQKRIKSPDLGELPFKYVDPKMRSVHFFATPEKLEKFLQKQA